MNFTVTECSLRTILVAQSGRGVCAILMGEDAGMLERDLRQRFPRDTVVPGKVAMAKTLKLVRTIPAGETASYRDIAERIGSPGAVRAVAQACAANPVAVAIPCHRVVRHDGALSGYRWGAARKRALLAREARA